MKELVFLGASASFLEILGIVQDINAVRPQYKITAILDDNQALQGTSIEGVSVTGSLTDVKRFPNASFIFGIGSYKIRHKRLAILERIGLPDERYETLVHPRASIYPTAKVGAGSILYPGVMVCPGAHVEPFVIIGPNAAVGPAQVMRGALVGSHSVILARGRIGHGAYVGVNSCINEGVSVGPAALVGIGSVVFTDVPAGVTVIGNPAHFVSQMEVPADLLALWPS